MRLPGQQAGFFRLLVFARTQNGNARSAAAGTAGGFFSYASNLQQQIPADLLIYGNLKNEICAAAGI